MNTETAGTLWYKRCICTKQGALTEKMNNLLEMRVSFSSDRICRDDEGAVIL